MNHKNFNLIKEGFQRGYIEKVSETIAEEALKQAKGVGRQLKGMGSKWWKGMQDWGETMKGPAPEIDYSTAMQNLAEASTPDYLGALKRVAMDPFMRGSDVPDIMRSSGIMTSKHSVTDPRFFYQQYWPALTSRYGD